MAKTKKVLQGNFFEDEGDIIDRIIREEELLSIATEVTEKSEEEKKYSPPLKSNPKPLDDREDVGQSLTLDKLAAHYHRRLTEKSELLEKPGFNPEMVNRLKLGYSDGKLVEKTGKNQRKTLVDAGILDEKGNEILSGYVIFPLSDEYGKVTGLVGIHPETGATKQIGDGGFLNEKTLKVYDRVILTDNLFDCVALIGKGLDHVVGIEGQSSFTGDHLNRITGNRVKEVILTFSNEIILDLLTGEGIAVRVLTEKIGGQSREDIEVLIEQTEVFKPKDDGKLFEVKRDVLGYVFLINGILYRVIGVKETFVNNLKVNIRVEYQGKNYPDSVDLYSARSRDNYSRIIGRIFELEPKRIEKDLLVILDHLEKEMWSKLSAGKQEEKRELTADEREAGMKFLTDPNLFDEIVADMTALGYVGEDLNKQLLYLCASSRILDDPISVMIVSQSASGKSMLVDTVKKLIPSEDVVAVTSLSDQALNYIPDLMHKFMVFGEAVHSEAIEHQIREMLSGKELSRLVTVKDEKTGKMSVELVKKDVLVSAVMTTTSNRINPENLSRFFVINANETREQTRLIHEEQRKKYTLERIEQKKERIPAIIKKHRSAQMLLRKILIVNNLGQYMDFPDSLMRTRRDHDRFIDLIATVCFLRQYQKEWKRSNDVDYVECDLADYEIARNIAVNCVLSSTFADLPITVVEFYEALRNLARETAKENNLEVEEVGFDQRDVRAKVKWLGNESIKKYLRILTTYEYIQLETGGAKGKRNTYRLIADESIDRLDLTVIPTVDQIKMKMENTKT